MTSEQDMDKTKHRVENWIRVPSVKDGAAPRVAVGREIFQQ